MRSIVEDLLMLARADDGSLELLRAPVDLAGVTEAVTQNASVLARPKRVGIVTQGPRATVLADRARIEQVAMNLVNNAIRFSPDEGRVTITTWLRGGGAGWTVNDEGPGVSPELAGHIFERFVRGDAARSNDGGSGLGLAISSEIVEAHGGRIWVDVRPGAGVILLRLASGRRRGPAAEGVREGPAAPDPPSVGTEGSTPARRTDGPRCPRHPHDLRVRRTRCLIRPRSWSAARRPPRSWLRCRSRRSFDLLPGWRPRRQPWSAVTTLQVCSDRPPASWRGPPRRATPVTPPRPPRSRSVSSSSVITSSIGLHTSLCFGR